MHSKHREYLEKEYAEYIKEFGFDEFVKRQLTLMGRQLGTRFHPKMLSKQQYIDYLWQVLKVVADPEELVEGYYFVTPCTGTLMIEL